jgi:hypothetical protein
VQRTLRGRHGDRDQGVRREHAGDPTGPIAAGTPN